MIATIEQKGGWVSIQTPYNSDFVDALKSAIAYTDRKWDRPTKCWLIAEAEAPSALTVATRFFEVQDHRGKDARQIAAMEDETENKALIAEIEQIKADQAYILENEERIEQVIKDLSVQISRYSFSSKSSIKGNLARTKALLQHSLDNARISVERLTELQVKGLASAVRYLSK